MAYPESTALYSARLDGWPNDAASTTHGAQGKQVAPSSPRAENCATSGSAVGGVTVHLDRGPQSKDGWLSALGGQLRRQVGNSALLPVVIQSQRAAMIGEVKAHTNRPELVAVHGYDTKFAMHALRLGVQGVELLTSGRITLPVPDPDGSYLHQIRRGEIALAEVIARSTTRNSA